MKKSKSGMILVQSLFSYMMIIFIILFSLDIFQNMTRTSVNQMRSLEAHKVLKKEVIHVQKGDGISEPILLTPFRMEVTEKNGGVCISYTDASQKEKEICNRPSFAQGMSWQFVD